MSQHKMTLRALEPEDLELLYSARAGSQAHSVHPFAVIRVIDHFIRRTTLEYSEIRFSQIGNHTLFRHREQNRCCLSGTQKW